MAFLLALSPVAWAEDEPTTIDSSGWMSFEAYNAQKATTDKALAISTPALPGNAASVTPAATQPATNSTPPDKDGHGVADDHSADVTLPNIKSGVAPPTRPINVPVMPGVNKGYHMQVNSTEDERAPIAHITDIDNQPTVSLPNRNWQTPQEAQQSDADDDAQKPLNIRMSFLPNTHIIPAPSPQAETNHGRPALPILAMSQAAEQPRKADPAACAAVDAYKKKQLEAIASDRETLANLQKAIAQLGLQKELSFMTGASGKVNQADSGFGKMDVPIQANNAAKN